MSITKLEIGGIYKTDFDDLPIKIISFDDYEVLYDAQWEKGKWMFSNNLRRKTSFYRISTNSFKKKSTFIKNIDFREREVQTLRPHLPLRFGRFKNYSWDNLKQEDLENIKRELNNKKLNIDRVILIPYGPQGGFKKGVEIKNEDNLSFFEIVKNAKDIQRSINEEPSNGIGIYRNGFEKGIPSFYIGEYIDRAKILLK